MWQGLNIRGVHGWFQMKNQPNLCRFGSVNFRFSRKKNRIIRTNVISLFPTPPFTHWKEKQKQPKPDNQNLQVATFTHKHPNSESRIQEETFQPKIESHTAHESIANTNKKTRRKKTKNQKTTICPSQTLAPQTTISPSTTPRSLS